MLVVVAGLGLTAACVVPVPPPPPPTAGAPTLTVTPHLSGLARPWDLAFAPDATLLFTERPGAIKADVGGAVRVLGRPADVQAIGEGGMMGLAVDPQFTANRRIYTCFLSNADGALDVRVVRWRVDAGYTTLTDRADIVTGIAVNTAGQAGRHSGCRTRFGPDGYLWVTTGDAATSWVPQSPTSLGGKVLRVTTDGAGAPGNPGGALRPEIYSYGHRNPQGVAFRPGDGMPFAVEHGTGCDDEVNLLVAGGNYGWDPVPVGGGTSYDESRPMTDLTRYPTARPAVWSSGCPTIAPSGAGFLEGAQWKDWDGDLAVAVLKGTQLRVFGLDGAGAVVAQASGVTDQGRLRVAVQGPGGDLYIAQDADPGAILRVQPG
ncbi:MAG: PQQ-dependent sugar dehydrogenase [Acidimicrobiales bacterium]